MTQIYVIAFYGTMLGPLVLGLLLLGFLWARAARSSPWSDTQEVEGWHPLDREVRRRSTITLGYRNLDASAWRWHLTAVALALAPLWAWLLALAWHWSANITGFESLTAVVGRVASEITLFAIAGTIPFALVYLNRLYRGRVRGAEFYAIAVWVAPRLAIAPFFAGSSADGVDVGVVTIVGFAAVCTLTMAVASVRRRTAATPTLAYVAAAGLAVAAGAIASSNPYAVIDAIISSLCIGFGVYVIRSREQRFERDLIAYLRSRGNILRPAHHDHTVDVIGNWPRLAMLIVAAAGGALALGIYRWTVSATAAEEGADTGVASAAAVALAVAVAATIGAGVWFTLRRRFDRVIAGSYGIIVAVIGMLFVSVVHVGSAFYKPTGDAFPDALEGGFAISAIVAAVLLGAAIMHPRSFNLRSFVLAFAWPGLLILGLHGDSSLVSLTWHGAALVGITTLCTLWAIWYGTNPPRFGEARFAEPPQTVTGAPGLEPRPAAYLPAWAEPTS